MPFLRCPTTCGREVELGVLRAALEGLDAGTGAMVLICGPAGVGKSRLAGDVSDMAEANGVRVAVGRARRGDSLSAYRPLSQALLHVLGDLDLPEADERLGPWRIPLDAILAPAAPDRQLLESSASVRGESVLQMLRRVVPRSGPGLVVVLEDLHWADLDTLAVLDYVADAVRSLPVLWLLTFRDGATTPVTDLAQLLTTRRSVTCLRLGPLGPAAVAQMVQRCDPSADLELIDRVQRVADGVPLYVEQIVAARGVPDSFARAVGVQLAALDEPAALVVEAAAVIGVSGAWDLLPAVAGLPEPVVAAGLEEAVGQSLLAREPDGYRFRHTLTRQAVLAALPSGHRRRLAEAALQELQGSAASGSSGTTHGFPGLELVADLAEQVGDHRRAGLAIADAGRRAALGGGLATAAEALRRASRLLTDEPEADGTRLALIEVLGVAGRVDEALSEGESLLAGLAPVDGDRDMSGQVQLALAEAAARAARWTVAERYLGAAGNQADSARAAMLGAELAFARGRADQARELADQMLSDNAATSPALRCRAGLLLGRAARAHDLVAARESFEQALALARSAHDRLRELDALHELGTIEMFEHAGTSRLLEARALADSVGAPGTRAVLDLQLAAAYLGRFETSAAQHHAEEALEIADRLGQDAVAGKALSELAETCAQRLDRAGMERYLALAASRHPEDPLAPAFAWGQCRGLLAFYEGDWTEALACHERGIRLLERVPQPEPIEFRALWPLLLAWAGDPRAERELETARHAAGLHVAFANRGLLGYAAAVLAGRGGDRSRATDLALRADAYLARFPLWTDLARLCAVEAAQADGWGRPEQWHAEAQPRLAASGFEQLARRCASDERPKTRAGLTRREVDVLELVAQGLANKEVGEVLHLSPRTVEKHVESLLRKTGTRSRTRLAVWASMGETT